MRVLWRTVLVSALLSMAPGISAAADATWKTHQDVNCGVELKYQATYSLEASGAPDYCSLWMRIGVKQARGLRVLFSLEIRETESSVRPPNSPRDFATASGRTVTDTHSLVFRVE